MFLKKLIDKINSIREKLERHKDRIAFVNSIYIPVPYNIINRSTSSHPEGYDDPDVPIAIHPIHSMRIFFKEKNYE